MDSVLADLSSGPADLPTVEDAQGIWTRGDLRDATARARAYLRRQGIGPGDRVAIVTPAGDKRVVAALLGARAAGTFTCPIDARDAAADVARIKPRIVIGGTAEGAIPFEALLNEPGEPLSSLPATPSDAHAWGVGTSGSSGNRRTVILTEGSVAHVTLAIQKTISYSDGDRIHGGLPLHHTYGLSQLWLAMTSGACLFLPSGQPTVPNLKAWLGGATVVPTIPAKLRLLLALGYRPEARLITLAGQGADQETRTLFAKEAPNTRFVSFYGLTEASTRVLWLDHEEFFSDSVATGRPISGVRAWVDSEGELWVEGPNVAAGYLDNPEATARRFPDGKLRTGDYFDVVGDLFRYRGRMDGVFKRSGEKVVPELVESALASHPTVEKCLVTGEVGRDGDTHPVAWVVARGAAPEARTLIQHARTLLPGVMVPSKINFVESLAMTSNGKLVRKAPVKD